MWAVAALNKKYSDALGTYNSLQDPHLHQYFRKPKIRNHLIQAGLMTSEGKVIPEAVVRLRKLEDERRKQLHELLTEVLEKGQTNGSGLRRLHQTRTLESEVKWELIQRAKIAFNDTTNGSNGVSSRTLSNNSSTDKTKKSSSTTSSMNWFKRVALMRPKVMSYKKRQVRVNAINRYQRPKSSYGVRSSRKITPDIQVEQELIEQLSGIVSLDGDSIHDSDEESGQKKRKSRSYITLQFNGLTASSFTPRRVKILQQLHSGGNAIVIFDRLVTPGDSFTFCVRPHGSKPFCITVLIDDIRDLRVSTCCEHKHKKGSKISHFKLIDVIGGKPCYNCRNTFEEPKNSRELNNNHENNSNIERNSSKHDIYLSDSDVDELQETVIEKKSSQSSSPINADYNEDQFEAYESSAETPSSLQIRSPNSVSSDDNSIVGAHTEVVEAEVHSNPQ